MQGTLARMRFVVFTVVILFVVLVLFIEVALCTDTFLIAGSLLFSTTHFWCKLLPCNGM